jgi:hypothetical protein
MFEALIHEITIASDSVVKPVFKLPLAGNDEGLDLHGPAPTSDNVVRALPRMVDLTARYSNRPDELVQLRELLKRIAAGDQSGDPGLDGKPDQAPATRPPRPRKLVDRLRSTPSPP